MYVYKIVLLFLLSTLNVFRVKRLYTFARIGYVWWMVYCSPSSYVMMKAAAAEKQNSLNLIRIHRLVLHLNLRFLAAVSRMSRER